MKKEVLVAILIGFGVGLFITGGIYYTQNNLKQTNQILSPIADKKPQTVVPEKIPSILSLTSPLDESISNQPTVPVIGNTSPSAWVVILTEKGELVVQADAKGNFETSINLISGENEIEVQSINDKGEAVSKTITVVYSTAEI
ncbi:MAG: hypothetical protein ACPLY7_01690 [Microgenomates group bacterium]